MTTSAYTFENLDMVRASQDDIDEIHSLWAETADWLKSKKIDQWRDEQVTREAVVYCYNNSEMFLVKSNNTTVGTFFIVWSDPFIWKGLDNGSSGYLHRLVVRRKYAGNHLGSKLLALAEQYIRRSGMKYFRLDCMAENPILNDFYQKAGFQYKGRVDGEDWSASLFEKEL